MEKKMLMAGAVFAAGALALAAAADVPLEEAFRNPPPEARPHTWWHWMNGNVSKEGISADLDAMARVGIGGVQIFDAGLAIPAGPVAFGTDAWIDHVVYAIQEAGKRGIEVVLSNCSGWSSTGGPWVTPDDAMKIVACSKLEVEGPRRFETDLPVPTAAGTVKDWYRDIAVLAFPSPEPGATIDDFACRVFLERKIAMTGGVHAVSAQCVKASAVRDVSSARTGDHFTWDVPAGRWTILRVGYRARNRKQNAASRLGNGLECDKLSAAALDRSFDAYVGKVAARVGRSSALKGVLIDSYEVGCQNWTQGFADEFAASRGYAITPWLPVLAGFVVDSPDATEGFLRDFRTVIGDLFCRNYAGRMAARCHEKGLLFHCEAYGNGPFNDLRYGLETDVPMCEFWSFDERRFPHQRVKAEDFEAKRNRPWGCKMIGNPKTAASIAHVRGGDPTVSAEAFTAYAEDSRWTKGPLELKAEGDRIFCGGVTRIVYHRYAHQPWANPTRWPGMTMAHYGMNMERTQTWWDHGAKEWFAYQSRCQSLLRQGKPVADVLFWTGDDVPNNSQAGTSRRPDAIRDAVPSGYDYDVCETTMLMKLKVERNCVVTPGGVRYRVLALPAPGSYTALASRRKLDALIVGGVNVVPCDEVAEALADVASEPDFSGADLALGVTFIHRRTVDSDIYFVAQPNDRPVAFDATFRARGRVVELWDAVTGEIRAANVRGTSEYATTIPLQLGAYGSVFVVFRDHPTPDALPAAGAVARTEIPVTAPWNVSFREPGREEPVATATFTTLNDWTCHTNLDIRYFSGTATYAANLSAPAHGADDRVWLDLGEVKNIAEVKVNGRVYPALWKPPFRIDVTDAVRDLNDVEIRVTNYWPNRLIGDETLCAPDAEYNDTSRYPPLTVKEWPEWLQAGKPSPTGRHAFATCHLWTASDALLPSGLLGPVKFVVEKPVR